MDEGLRLEWRSPAELAENPSNWRRHPEAQLSALTDVLAEVGWAGACLYNEQTGRLIDGHARRKVALEQGAASVPVLVGSWDEATERKILATLDPLAAMAEADGAALDALLRGVDTGSEALQEMLASLADDAGLYQTPEVKEDEALEPPAVPITKPGDLWVMGEHRLLCGDSTKAEDVSRLMDGNKAALCLSDPPYNVGFDYGNNTNDEKTAGEYAAWCRRWFDLCPAASVVLTVGMVNLAMWYRAIGPPDWLCAWLKVNQCSRSGLGGFNVWEPLLVYGKPAKNVGHDAWSVPIGQQSDTGDHPCPKSLKAWAEFLAAFTDTGDAAYEPFSGSGTTLIAAEQLGRRCFAMEISPAYCDVAVQRWEKLTGKKAERA